jgi:hypothetical protein
MKSSNVTETSAHRCSRFVGVCQLPGFHPGRMFCACVRLSETCAFDQSRLFPVFWDCPVLAVPRW